MGTNRLEAFSDGVIAIIITIMVLELKVPQTAELAGMKPLAPVLLSYVLSFIYVGIYWNNHHHLFQTVRQISGGILWANLHLLFWLSLLAFATAWVGEDLGALVPNVLYGVVLLMTGIAPFVLQRVIIRHQGPGSVLEPLETRSLFGFYDPGCICWSRRLLPPRIQQRSNPRQY